MASSDNWFPEGYSPNISTEDWLKLLGDKDICREESLITLKCLKDFGGEATCKQLSVKYGRHSQFYNLASSRLAKRVAQQTGCPILERNNENARWWPVLFWGRHTESSTPGSYIWKLRTELSEALDRYDLSAVPLYGNTEKKDEYQRAAEMLLETAKEKGIDTEELAYESEQQRRAFAEWFSPEKLLRIPDDKLLGAMGFARPTSKNSMMYHLETQTESWGRIQGVSSCKFDLFQREKDQLWVNAHKQVLPEEQALAHAKGIREKLVRGSHIIENATLSNCEEIENLDKEMKNIFGESFTNFWIQKYFALLYPDKISCFYSTDLQNHVLYACGIRPSRNTYTQSAQIAIISNYNNWHYPEFFHVFTLRFGTSPKKFYRLGSIIENKNMSGKWKEKSIVAIGWPEIGCLKGEDGKLFEKKELIKKLQKNYYQQNKNIASRKAGELTSFYNTHDSSVFIVMDGEKPLALVDNLGEYFYTDDPSMPHCKHGDWHMSFGENERLPYKLEGLHTSCWEFKDPRNILYLYRKYYNIDYIEVDQNNEDIAVNNSTEASRIERKINFKLRFPSSDFTKNRIIFGAPGTGKSYRLKKDAEKLCGHAVERMERVTFHPDYAYSHFMGCYKPQTTPEGNVRYGFVPGPFLRVLVKALRSGMSGDMQPYLLLIEEINRARVAAVFGDTFQLLDRVDDDYSEYDIVVSEDVKEYLGRELDCSPEDCGRIRIPGNMFIWATMNSADQGVFPMDTAFKRRWSFEYLPIDPAGAPDVLIPMKVHDAVADIPWNVLRGAINNRLSELRINEDKLIGPYFLKPSVLDGDESGRIKSLESFTQIFKAKVLMYLFEDAARQRRQEVFKGCTNCHRYSSLCREFDKNGLSIFGDDFIQYSS